MREVVAALVVPFVIKKILFSKEDGKGISEYKIVLALSFGGGVVVGTQLTKCHWVSGWLCEAVGKGEVVTKRACVPKMITVWWADRHKYKWKSVCQMQSMLKTGADPGSTQEQCLCPPGEARERFPKVTFGLGLEG